MNKEKDEVMKNHTLAIYESTFNKLVQFKELRNWTHDRALNELIKSYEQDVKMDVKWLKEEIDKLETEESQRYPHDIAVWKSEVVELIEIYEKNNNGKEQPVATK